MYVCIEYDRLSLCTLNALCVRVWPLTSAAYTRWVRACVRVYVKYAVGSEREREKIHIHIKSMWVLWGSMTYIQCSVHLQYDSMRCGSQSFSFSILTAFALTLSILHSYFKYSSFIYSMNGQFKSLRKSSANRNMFHCFFSLLLLLLFKATHAESQANESKMLQQQRFIVLLETFFHFALWGEFKTLSFA